MVGTPATPHPTPVEGAVLAYGILDGLHDERGAWRRRSGGPVPTGSTEVAFHAPCSLSPLGRKVEFQRHARPSGWDAVTRAQL